MSIPHRFVGDEVAAKAAPARRADPVVESDPVAFTDADAVAVRAIAHYNVERRRAGEPALDLKGIARLRHFIAREIDRSRALTGPKPADVQ